MDTVSRNQKIFGAAPVLYNTANYFSGCRTSPIVKLLVTDSLYNVQ